MCSEWGNIVCSIIPKAWNIHTAIVMFQHELFVHSIAALSRLAPLETPLEFFFPEQSYSSLHSGWSLAWDHVRGDINDPCGAIVDFCRVIADPCSVVPIPEAIGSRAVADRCATL